MGLVETTDEPESAAPPEAPAFKMQSEPAAPAVNTIAAPEPAEAEADEAVDEVDDQNENTKILGNQEH